MYLLSIAFAVSLSPLERRLSSGWIAARLIANAVWNLSDVSLPSVLSVVPSEDGSEREVALEFEEEFPHKPRLFRAARTASWVQPAWHLNSNLSPSFETLRLGCLSSCAGQWYIPGWRLPP